MVALGFVLIIIGVWAIVLITWWSSSSLDRTHEAHYWVECCRQELASAFAELVSARDRGLTLNLQHLQIDTYLSQMALGSGALLCSNTSLPIFRAMAAWVAAARRLDQVILRYRRFSVEVLGSDSEFDDALKNATSALIVLNREMARVYRMHFISRPSRS